MAAKLTWWAKVLLVWGLTRLYITALFLVTAFNSGPSYWNEAKPGYFDYLNIWDVEWFWRIFTYGLGEEPGYATQLPVSPEGYVSQNSWAFMPGWPMLVRLVSFVAPLEWKYLAPLVATVLGFVFALLAYRILSLKMEQGPALWAVAFIGLWPGSAVLQTGYAESLGLCLLAAGLWYLLNHRYLAALPFLAAFSITRPGLVALAAALAGLWVMRWYRSRHGGPAFASADRLKLAGMVVVTGALGFAWLVTAWVFTGRIDAYPATELAWRWRDSADERVTPFKGLWQAATQWWGGGLLPLVLLAGALAVVAWLLLRPSVKRLGPELQLWSASYILYLAAVFYPHTSTFRILLPAFPLAGALALALAPRSRVVNWAVIALLAALQIWWFEAAWVYSPPDFAPP